MSMTTAIKMKKTGKIVRFITAQYMVGLYVAIYTDGQHPPSQCVSKMEQVKFHRKLRKDIVKNKDIFLKEESDPLNAKEVFDLQNQFALAYCENTTGPTTCARWVWVLSWQNWIAFQIPTK